jgi:hypothetical protein
MQTQIVLNNRFVDKERTTTKKRTKEECSEQAAYVSLNKNLIAPLQNWRFVIETKVGCLFQLLGTFNN